MLHPSTSSRIFLRLIIFGACCRRWRMVGMTGYPPLGWPGSRYPGRPSLALMGAPEALVAGPGFLRGLAGEGGKQVYSGQGRWAPSPSGLLQRSAPKSGVSREAREDQIPASLHQDPISTLLQITQSWVELQPLGCGQPCRLQPLCPLGPVSASLPAPNQSLSPSRLCLSPQ